MAGRSPETLLLEHSVIDADQLARAIAERYGLDHIDLNGFQVDMGAANLIAPTRRAAIGRSRSAMWTKARLLVAMADPANVLAVDDIQMMTGLALRGGRRRADEDIEALIRRLNTLENAVTEAIEEEEEFEELAEVDRAPRVGRRRAGDQARLLDPRPGGRTRAPPTSTSSPPSARCASASGWTASCTRPRGCRSE